MAQHFEEVIFIGTVGNHGRFEQKPVFKEKTNNSDWIIYNMIKALVADQTNIEVRIPSAPWVTLNIQGHEFFFAHGDQIKMYTSFPWYDTKRYTGEMSQLLVAQNKPYPKYWGFGHFHLRGKGPSLTHFFPEDFLPGGELIFPKMGVV